MESLENKENIDLKNTGSERVEKLLDISTDSLEAAQGTIPKEAVEFANDLARDLINDTNDLVREHDTPTKTMPLSTQSSNVPEEIDKNHEMINLNWEEVKVPDQAPIETKFEGEIMAAISTGAEEMTAKVLAEAVESETFEVKETKPEEQLLADEQQLKAEPAEFGEVEPIEEKATESSKDMTEKPSSEEIVSKMETTPVADATCDQGTGLKTEEFTDLVEKQTTEEIAEESKGETRKLSSEESDSQKEDIAVEGVTQEQDVDEETEVANLMERHSTKKTAEANEESASDKRSSEELDSQLKATVVNELTHDQEAKVEPELFTEQVTELPKERQVTKETSEGIGDEAEQLDREEPDSRFEPRELEGAVDSQDAKEGTEEVAELLESQQEGNKSSHEAQQSFRTAVCNSQYFSEDFNDQEEEEEISQEMEFTKNYSDDLLMGQSNDGNQQGEAQSSSINADLADFELPPYSGSSSGSEPRQQSPVKERKSSSKATTSTSTTLADAHASSSQVTVAPPDLKAVRNLIMSSYSRFSHVFQWKRPIETGIYFALGISLITALTFFSIISVFAYSTLSIILASSSLRLYKATMKTLNRSSDTPIDHVWNRVLNTDVSLSSDKIHELLDTSLSNLNASLIYFKQVLIVDDKFATLKFGLIIYMLTYIGAWFNGMTLLTLGYLGLFSVPVFYEKNKTQIDGYVNSVTGQVSSTVSMVTNKATSMVFGSSSSSTGKKQN